MLIIREEGSFKTIFVGTRIAHAERIVKIKDVIGNLSQDDMLILNIEYYRPITQDEINQYFTDEEILELL